MAFIDTIVAAFAADAGVGAIAAGVAAVGTDLSVVGAITGNKTMTEVGGVMGLAGGVVGLASGAFSGAAAAGSDSSLTSSLTDSANAGANVGGTAGVINPAVNPITDASQSALSTADSTATTGATGAALTDPNSLGLPQPGAAGVTGNPLANPMSANDIGGTQTDIGATQNNLAGTTPPTPTPAGNPNATQGVRGYADNSQNINLPQGIATGTGGGTTGASGSTLQGMLSGYSPQAQQALIQAAGQGVAGMVGGLFNGWSQSQKLQLAQQAQALQQTQYTNAMQNASSQPVLTASAKPPSTAGTGLLNSVQSSNV